ncbi:hypothetical protein [Thermopirellula anaerolimosa]|jgi:hypothetical protein
MDTDESQPRKRGGCLTAWLVFLILANLWVALQNLVAGAIARQAIPDLPAWVMPLTGLWALADCVFAIGIWKWKRWGLYGFIGSSLAAFVVNLMTTGFVLALLGLVGVGILAFLLRPVWRHLE